MKKILTCIQFLLLAIAANATGKKEYHNFVLDGFSFDKVNNPTIIRELFPLQIEKYPELTNIKRINFSIKTTCRRNGKTAEGLSAMESFFYQWRISC